ncbi:BgTH12-07968 [Blumeria graminis f. sp. triticale]|uniref:ATP-dependent RNA helicase n=4 Tax=Blumeria graminis TaxID=34373 RepID=A0A656KEZ1_BLUGR|nr:ATP-dependent RNA helicase of the DEAD-box family [Blumeria graminis f. sp. tritici 96224]CAD6504732.1 BgTH12-07968 [Blumeria graminis f. sp. triticale]VCU39489.1 Bgt-5333 [Blumeria graminis f. sp. tritici]
MADDELLMNFEIGELPIIPKLKFQGGRWKDRLIAKKGAAKRATQGKERQNVPENKSQTETHVDGTTNDYIGPGTAPNPPKRQRIENRGAKDSINATPEITNNSLVQATSRPVEANQVSLSNEFPQNSVKPTTSRSNHEARNSSFHQDTRSSFVAGKLPPGSIKISAVGGNQTNSKKIVFGDTPENLNSGKADAHRELSTKLKSGQIISSLFSFNPAAISKDEDSRIEAQNTKPSNAPLTAELETFTALGLSSRLASHLFTKLSMKAPTAIQKAAIPIMIKEDNDAFIQAETGSGKTLAYLLPIVQRIIAMSDDMHQVHRDSGLFAIVLAPTRELCKQIATVLEKILRCAPWIVGTTVIGGESKQSEKARLRKGVNILIATPGRLADHLDNTEVLKVETVRWVVLDEGDRLMELGFEDEIKKIMAKIDERSRVQAKINGIRCKSLPQRRVAILCSATMKMNVQRLGEISLKDAIHIAADSSDENIQNSKKDQKIENSKAFSAPAQLKQAYGVVPAKLRLVTLTAVLKRAFARRGSVMKAIVFMSCADSVDFHFSIFSRPVEPSSDDKEDSSSTPIIVKTEMTKDTIAYSSALSSRTNPVIIHRLHGSLAQNVRTATLKAFTESTEPCIIICTDVASRGLDMPNVDYVIEYDPPFSSDDHLHRVGRTARAGKDGRALIFLLPGEEEEYISILASGYQDGRKALSHNTAENLLMKGFGGVGNQWQERATELQLEIERWTQDSPKYLEMARRGFQSHIRAYATHVASERHIFNMQTLHLGHLAKAFALRDKPGSIKVPGLRPSKTTKADRSVASRKARKGEEEKAPEGERIWKQKKLDLNLPNLESNDSVKRMKRKIKEHSSAINEFNIG